MRVENEATTLMLHFQWVRAPRPTPHPEVRTSRRAHLITMSRVGERITGLDGTAPSAPLACAGTIAPMHATSDPAPARAPGPANASPVADLLSRLADEADTRRRDLRRVEDWASAVAALAAGHGTADVVRLVVELGGSDTGAPGTGCALSAADLRLLSASLSVDDVAELVAAPWTPTGHTLVVAWLEARAEDPGRQARAVRVLHGQGWPGLRKVMAALLIEPQPEDSDLGRPARSADVSAAVQAARDAAYDVAAHDATAGVLFGLHARAALAVANGAVVAIRRSLDVATSGRYKLGAAFRSDQHDDASAAEIVPFLAALEPLELARQLVETFDRATPDRDEMARRRQILEVVTLGVTASPATTR